ncbi:hypothetical protein BC827DRAFT_1178750 [Russula dissimulans]|nr:hypothetical protein BC827DRAFT_1178750 [Russula dissimulans]
MARHPEPGAPRSFPHFHPHVTLANIQVPPAAAAVAASKPPSPAPAAAAAAGTSDNNHHHTFHSAAEDSNLGFGFGFDSERAELLLSLREALPLGQRAVRVRFARVLAGDHYFRSIFVALVPSPELARLRAAFRPAALALAAATSTSASTSTLTSTATSTARAAGRAPPPGAVTVTATVGTGTGVGAGPDEPPAFPHLSLYYVADGEAHVRARFLQELEREEIVRHSKDGSSVALRCVVDGESGGGGDDRDGVLEGFTGTQIWIVDCVGPVEGWKILDKILLGR